ncbi:MAG TPA: hypothetical protein VMT35_04845 [Ignavibacteriaceae bacterium]|nr:hypothetical protein [Ignavibacteriaceae bacterium]
MSYRKYTILILYGLLSFIVYSCRPDKVEIEYKPLFIPAKLVLDNQGNVSIKGETSIVTLIGEFSINAQYKLQSEENSIIVILRDRNKGTNGFDKIYRIRSNQDEFVAVVNGTTTIQIVNRQVLIDVSNGGVKSIIPINFYTIFKIS